LTCLQVMLLAPTAVTYSVSQNQGSIDYNAWRDIWCHSECAEILHTAKRFVWTLYTDLIAQSIFLSVSQYVCLLMLNLELSNFIMKLTFTIFWTWLFEMCFYFIFNRKVLLLLFYIALFSV
jgi:hypothetical protein